MMRCFLFFIFLLLLSSCESPESKKSNLTFAELYGDLSTEKINNNETRQTPAIPKYSLFNRIV